LQQRIAKSFASQAWPAFAFVGVLSCIINILYLTGSIFMLQVYDRVIPSRSLPTLVALFAVVAGLFLFQALLDLIRSRIFVRLGLLFDETMRQPVFDAVVRLPLTVARSNGDGLQPLRDVSTIRGFFAGGGPVVFLDLPWLPFFLGICFIFHPLIGIAATLGALILVIVALASEIMTRKPVKATVELSAKRLQLAEAGRRNAESLIAMGMTKGMRMRWSVAVDAEAQAQTKASDVGGGFGAVSKALRLLLQSAILAVGAYLVIDQQATGGIIIASSILTARALAPVEMAVGQWKNLIAARQSWARLKALMAAMPVEIPRTLLPPPKSRLTVDGVAVRAPGTDRILVSGVSFEIKAGSALGVIGPSASGKTSLARAIVGVWRPASGSVQLDGAPLDQWFRDELGKHVGYLPQDVELFAGTIAENIGRMAPQIDSEAVIRAAQAAGVHDMIVSLDGGYDAEVGDQGTALSKGQRQRVALARALYGEPFIVVLDEPNANLDQEGEAALANAVMSVRARGGVAVVVAHRPNAIAAVDYILMIQKGRQQAFGLKEDVLERVLLRPPNSSLKVVGSEDDQRA
jgi:ATP-binding cassette subfamily C protein